MGGAWFGHCNSSGPTQGSVWVFYNLFGQARNLIPTFLLIPTGYGEPQAAAIPGEQLESGPVQFKARGREAFAGQPGGARGGPGPALLLSSSSSSLSSLELSDTPICEL